MQGLGAAILSPAALSIVTTTFRDGAERNKALGVWGAVAGSGGAAGVLLGGVLTECVGWEWVLWVNVPIGLAAAALAPALIAESRSESATRAFDVAGAVSVTAGAVAAGLRARRRDQRRLGIDPDDRPAGRVSAVLLAAFVVIELRSQAPLVPFRIFRLRTLTGANVVGLLVGASLFSMFFFISLYMQQVLGYSAIKAGLSYLPLALTIIVVGGHRVAARHADRLQAGAAAPGMAFIAAGLIWFGQVSVGRQLPERHPRPVAARRGRPRLLVRAGHDRRGRRACREREAGLASGLINTSQQVGGALGLAVLATVANSRTDDLMAAARGNRAELPTRSPRASRPRS